MLKLGAVDYTTNVQRNIKSHKESSEKCRNSVSWQSQVASVRWAESFIKDAFAHLKFYASQSSYLQTSRIQKG